MIYLIHILFTLFIFGLLAISLDIIVGHLGILLLCHSAFYAIGSYITAILIIKFNVPIIISIITGSFVSAIISIPVALSARRLRHDAIVLASLGILLITIEFLRNLRKITGGLVGLYDIPSLQIGDNIILNQILLTLITGLLLFLCWNIIQRLINSPFGKCFHAVRDDLFLSLGLRIKPLQLIILAFFVSALIAGFAGGLYTIYSSYINPSIFNLDTSILILIMVLIGGPSTKYGSLLGALVFISLPEIFRIIGFHTIQIGAIYQVIFGILLIMFALIRPKGIFGGYEFK